MPRKSVSGIYRIVNKVNGRVYVGSASCLGGRKKAHEYRLIAGNHHSIKLQRAWAKYGKEAFEFQVIEHVTGEAALIEREQFWIDHYNASVDGYNVAAIAGRTVGVVVSQERRKKQSELMKGKKKSPEHIAAMSRASTGKVFSAETRLKISEAAKARMSKPESRARIGEANRNRVFTDEMRLKMSEAHKSRMTPEVRAQMAERQKGTKHTEEAKAKIAESNRRRSQCPEFRAHMSIKQKEAAARRMAAKAHQEGAASA